MPPSSDVLPTVGQRCGTFAALVVLAGLAAGSGSAAQSAQVLRPRQGAGARARARAWPG